MAQFAPTYFQSLAVDKTIKYIQAGGKAGILSMATGVGKSVTLANLIKRALSANNINVMVAVDSQELVAQNANKLFSINNSLDIGIYSAGLNQKDLQRQITFAGIQSAYNVDWHKIHLLIIDEVQAVGRNKNSRYRKLIKQLKDKNPNLVIIGLSATPFRLDSGLLTSGDDALFDTIIYDYNMAKGIQDGYLCPLVGKHTKTEYDFSSVKKVAGDYSLKDLEKVTNIDSKTKQAVEELIQIGKDRKCWMIYANGVKHSFAIRDELRRQGINAEAVSGETPKDERDRILKDYKAGKIRAVVNHGVWTTGLDVPIIDLIAMFRKTMSAGLLLQMAGRGTRPTVNVYSLDSAKDRRELIAGSSKRNCLFVDFASNIEEHGFIDQIKGKDKKKKEKGDSIPPMKWCEECFSICHASARKCPDCGYEFPINTEMKLGSAHNGAVMSYEDQGEWKIVADVHYIAHNLHHKKKKPCLRVKYILDDGTSISDYVCIMHEGYARNFALEWWKGMGGSIEALNGLSLEVVTQYVCPQLNQPTRVLVGKEGKYDKIKEYDFGYEWYGQEDLNNDLTMGSEQTLADMEDIVF